MHCHLVRAWVRCWISMEEPPMISNGPAMPPPLPPTSPRPSGNSFARQAASFSLWAPVVIFVLNLMLTAALGTQTGEGVRLGKLIVGGIDCFVIFCGVVLGVVALCVKEPGQKGVLGRALTGLVLNGLLVAGCVLVFVTGFNKAKERAEANKAWAAFHASVDEAREDTKKELNGGRVDLSAPERLEKVQKSIENASHNLKGEEALVAQAGSAYLQKAQDLTKEFTVALKGMAEPPVLDMRGVEKQEDLETKRVAVRNFLAANEKFKAFFASGDARMKEELVKLNISERMTESCLKGFRSKEYIRAGVVKIRETDVRIGNATLGAIDVLDENWGKWKYSEEKKMVLFGDQATLDKYNAFMAELKDASLEQRKLQQQAVNQAK
jgi:hypothetical protein